MPVWEVAVRSRYGDEPEATRLLDRWSPQGVTGVQVARKFRLEGDLEAGVVHRLASQLLCEDVTHTYAIDAPVLHDGRVVEVAYKPGVMNPEVASILKAAADLGVPLVAADSSREYAFAGDLGEKEFAAIVASLMNPAVQRIVTERPTTLIIRGDRVRAQTIPVRTLGDADLMALSETSKLALNLAEMRVIQGYFRELGRDPTDAELETLAQTWSEHCQHKTFKATIMLAGEVKAPFIERIMGVSAKYGANVVSAFLDNSGVIKFYDGYVICAKAETHNSPSALDPYGGAATGSGGVFRDIMGTGLGAKVILSTDVFCFAPPDMAQTEVPLGCLHPRTILEGVVAGVRDYGNRMGIPTANGSVHFHPDFRAKPTVIVGGYGIMEESYAYKGEPQAGDLVIAVGGRTGRDGVHGATFSSEAMTDRTATVSVGAVQIGNAIEEKRMTDALLACRDAGLIRAITDCGAGGFSSAVGEMGSKTGVRVHLERAPLKYQGLAPWEIWISESQERMVVAIAPEHLEQFLMICAGHNVEATHLGDFTGDQRLVVTYGDEGVIDLDMDFVHHGLPQRVMTASWQAPEWPEPNLEANIPEPLDSAAWEKLYTRVMAHGDICSKEPIVRGYDHGVQGTNVLPPYLGVHDNGPSDAVVLQPLPDQLYGMVVAHGLNPRLNLIDPYWGGVWAAVEAVANLTAVGGDLAKSALIDNFIWPFPTESQLGALDRAVDACVEIADGLRLPFVSGKDSLSSTYRKAGLVIEIPPVLCISVFGKIPDINSTVSADFKQTGSMIVFVGPWELKPALGGSVYYDLHGFLGNDLPQVDLALFRSRSLQLRDQIQTGHVLACHDVSEGGLAVTLAEMCIGGNCGAHFNLGVFSEDRLDLPFFSEWAGCFLVEVAEEHLTAFLQSVDEARVVGFTLEEPEIKLSDGRARRYTIPVAALKTAWAKPMQEVFS